MTDDTESTSSDDKDAAASIEVEETIEYTITPPNKDTNTNE